MADGVLDRFRRAVSAHGGRPAVAGTRTLTYRELDAASSAVAASLAAGGLPPEGLVGLVAADPADVIVGQLGALMGGGAYLPLDPGLPQGRIVELLRAAGCHAVVGTATTPAALDPAGLGIRLVDPAAPAPAADPPPARRGPRSLAYVIYTSGSTGAPKGVEIEDGALLSLLDWYVAEFALSPVDRGSCVCSPGFDAFGWETWPLLTTGGCVVCAPAGVRAAPGRLPAWLAAHRITVAFLPTPLAELFVDGPDLSGSALRAVLTGGDRLRHAPAREPGFRFVNNYGPTENTVCATSGDVRAGAEPDIGRPLPGVTVHLLDAELRPVPAGRPGEIFLGGRQVARGYRGAPSLTAQRFLPDPFSAEPGARMYRTGDLARLGADGRLRFLGRRDDQVQLRGVRVEPAEVEARLMRHPAVRHAGVVPAPAEQPTHLVAFCVVRPGAAVGGGELLAFLREHLPAVMVPRVASFVPELPLTANGKIDRARLAELARALAGPSPTGDADEAELTPAERTLRLAWADVLGLGDVGLDAQFSELGGDSLAALEICVRVQQHGLNLDPEDIFAHQTVRAIAAAAAR